MKKVLSLGVLLFLACNRIDSQIRLASPAKLFIPPLLDAGRGKVVVRAQRANHEIRPGVPSPSMGYNGTFLGPTILLHKGRKAQIEVINDLGEATTFHSHGAHIPGSADGGPTKIIPAGGSWMLDFLVKQQAATLWYHPHKMGRTAAQVWQGLAGLYIVRDADSLPLPQDYGVDDIPLVIQERLLDRKGRMLAYEQAASGHMTRMHGIRGNAFLVNGQWQPELTAASGWLRLRLLNGSNDGSYRIHLRNQRNQLQDFYQIASEQGLFSEPRKRRHLDLATGSRAEIMLELPRRAERLQLELALWNSGLTAPSRTSYPIMSIQVNPKQEGKGQLPAVLRAKKQQEGGSPSGQREFVLQMMAGRMMMGGTFAINGRTFERGTVNFEVPKGRYELWRFATDMLGHPVHIHGVQFRILKSAWQPAGSPDWHDTFTLATGEEALVLLRFTENADTANPYMLHCHMLEHEEAGMMAAFTVS